MRSFLDADATSQNEESGRSGVMNKNKGVAARKKYSSLDPKILKEKESTEVVHKLTESMPQLKFYLRSQEEQHNSDEFIFNLICTLAKACKAPSGKNTNKVLAALKGSVFLSSKIPCLLDRVTASTALNDQASRQRLTQCLIIIFMKFLTHLPSSYADLPYAQLKATLDHLAIEEKEKLQKELDAFKHARDEIIRAERQKHGQRYRVGEKPPNDYRDIPICPTIKEITTQERPFLRKNILRGRYENTEHYLDVQFRLLREDFLEPLREGIQEIVQNIPRQERKQLMKNYCGVRIIGKEYTWAGVIYQLKIDVSGIDTSRWAHSKRLMYGSFLCLSTDNFKTMLFATVCDRDPEKVRRGRIDVQFIEEQQVLGVENSNCVYQMVESPAYFESYRYVLKGLKELDESNLPFKKYLVECSAEVDPPEYLRRIDTEKPVCYNLSKALRVSNATSVPVLEPAAWPSAKTLSMNSSQLEALRTAITTEFSVIQGPPGTGKTYVGAKIVRCLLENRRAWDPRHISPMLMVCYTNHALDQFLEKVLNFLPSQKIIRVGGRSKSEKLDACNLKKFTHRYRDRGRRNAIEAMMKKSDREIKHWKKYLKKADYQLLEFDDLEQLLKPTHAQQLYKAMYPPNVAHECRIPQNTFKLWLCNNKQLASRNVRFNGSAFEKTARNTDNETLYEVSWLFAPQDHVNDDSNPSSLKDASLDQCTAMDVSKETHEKRLESEFVASEPTGSKYALPKSISARKTNHSLETPPRINASSLVLENKQDCSATERAEISDTIDIAPETECPHTENANICGNVDDMGERSDQKTIDVEREADIIQDQRLIEGEKELLLPISTGTADLFDLAHDQRGPAEEDDGEIPVASSREDQLFPWQKPKDRKEDKTVKNGSPKKKTRNKNKRAVIRIPKDITHLEQDLKQKEMMTTDEAMAVDNIWEMSQSDRLRLYLFWINNYRERYRTEVYRGEREYERLCRELEAVRSQEEEQVIRQATVVGMTTSGAAKHHSMLQRIAPKIVIIEEAAEVLEAHIITSLSQNTKHTILIGDHKQLRPKPTVYELAQKYNLEVSLFERMVMNSMDCKRLSTQHRMRPEIAALTKRIYDHQITDHETVFNFQDISGVCHNLFFVDHRQSEKPQEGLHSYANEHEAEFLVAFCKYLLLQGYKRSQITILTMYTGQLLLLQKKMPKEVFEGVKVSSVDNFQGEENDIILLSLVRSNSRGSIGFLSESNRICVALSRARQGFYCIGDFSLLKSQCKLWKQICDDLETKKAIGCSLELICKRHKNVTNATSARDFKHSKLGGCSMSCGERLDCGHACDRPCHASDTYHEEGYCPKMCSISCSNSHNCSQKCHYPYDCLPCSVLVVKTPSCGHEQEIECNLDPDDSFYFKCEKILTKRLPCGHEKNLPCYLEPKRDHCTMNCTKVLDCGHACSKKCKQNCQCDTEIDIRLSCDHRIRMLCREKDKPITCNEKCERVLDCGHDCPGICHEDCLSMQCKMVVLKHLPCGHQQSVSCFQDPKTAMCLAPCLRILACGHNCPSVCGRPCKEVQCEELCQRKCERGHSCQKRCHFSSPCDDCREELNMEIPSCGHSIKTFCHVDPATWNCQKPCERLRVCGHPCKEICSKNCDAQSCIELVARTLSCSHVVTLACHEDPEKFVCKKMVQVHLSCGHAITLECHLQKGGLDSVVCKEKVDKELPCKHCLTLPCYENPADCICRERVNVELPCGHTTAVTCSTREKGLANVLCTVMVPQRLPCNHEATLPCHMSVEEYICDKELEVTLSCGHKKLTTCSNKQDELQGGICIAKVTSKLLCGHETEIRCSDMPDKVFCDSTCESLLPCKHPCPGKCGEDCSSINCTFVVKKALSCGYHNVNCLCSEDVSQLICSNKCTRKLTCGHQCPGICSEICSQNKCLKLVMKPLSCGKNHSSKMYCKDDPLSVACLVRCKRNLYCGHPCPGLCGQPCSSMKCRRGVERRFSCGHRQHLRCFESKTATCKARCRRRKPCKHLCKGVCGEPCSKYPCNVVLGKTLPCGHKAKMPCSISVDNVQCPAPCETMLPCGHQCAGTCGQCNKRRSHEMCLKPCSRLLVCSHHCQATCSEPCPPCVRECSRRCPHERCLKPCSQPCKPCREPCTWICSHYQCKNLCGELCDRVQCEAPCPKKLRCGHPCIGLCGENCPTKCGICDVKTLSSMIGLKGVKTTEIPRCLQLLDCGHILKVEAMDAWMLQGLGRDVQRIQCPLCSTPITFSYRYANIIKRTLENIESVKAQIYELGTETAKSASDLVRDLRGFPFDLLKMKFPRNILHIVKTPSWHFNCTLSGGDVPLIYALKNHLYIMQQIKEGQSRLQRTEMYQQNSKDQQEIHESSQKIKDTFAEISEYLKTHRPLLATLNQVKEHTQKFCLFAAILEAQSKVTGCQRDFSSSGVTRLKRAQEKFHLFSQGDNEALQIDWLEKIVTSLRKEVNLPQIHQEGPKDFENFPGFNRGVWRLCEHQRVYFTRLIVRNGEHVPVVSNNCRQCCATDPE